MLEIYANLSENLKWRETFEYFGIVEKNVFVRISQLLSISARNGLKYFSTAWIDCNAIMGLVKPGIEYLECIHNKLIAPEG
jgi:hypothetical protein